MGQGGPMAGSCVGLCSQVVKEIIQVDIATGCRGLTGCKEPDSKQQQGVKQFFHQDIVNYGSLIRRDSSLSEAGKLGIASRNRKRDSQKPVRLFLDDKVEVVFKGPNVPQRHAIPSGRH